MRRIALGPVHTPEGVVLGVRVLLALGQAGLVAMVLTWTGGRHDPELTCGAASALTLAASWLATRAPIDRWVLRATLASGAPCGLAIAWGMPGSPGVTFLWLSAVAAAGCGLVCAVVVAPAAWIARAPSHDSLDRAAVAVAAWLAGALGLGRMLDAPSTSVDAAVLSVALLAFAIGAARMVVRRRWLARVVAGHEAGLAALSAESSACDGACLPLGVGQRDGYVARERARNEGPFRGAVLRTPVAPLRARSHDVERGRAERGVLAFAVAVQSGALGALALAIAEETIWRTEYGLIPASAYHGVALSTALLAAIVALVGTYAPTARWVGRIVVLALPAGLLEGGIAVWLACDDPTFGAGAFALSMMVASLVSFPSALVIGLVLAWTSVRAARAAAEPGSRARTARMLAPLVLTSGIIALLAGAWRSAAAVHGAIAVVTGSLLLVGASDRFRAWAISVTSRMGRTDHSIRDGVAQRTDLSP